MVEILVGLFPYYVDIAVAMKLVIVLTTLTTWETSHQLMECHHVPHTCISDFAQNFFL